MARRSFSTSRSLDSGNRLRLDSDCGACRYDAWFIEDRKVQDIIESIAEHGGGTYSLPERLKALEDNPPPTDAGAHTCGRAS